MTTKTIAGAKVSQDTLDKKGVATLRTSPSRGGTFGQNGLDAEALKQKFDELPEAIATQFNALCDILIAGNLEEAMAYVASINDHETTKKIFNLLTVIGDALAYNGKALATQEYTNGKVEDEADNRTAAIAAEASARAAEDEKKLDKVATPYSVYVTDGNGNQTTYSYSQSGNGTSIALRRSGGKLAVATATANDEAVPLKQMQEAISAEASERDDAIRAAISKLVGAAPETLDTLAELAAALKGNPDVVATLESAIADKASKKELATEKTAREQALAGKVDKITGSNRSGIYSVINGEQQFLSFSQEPYAYAIAYRTGGGQLRVGTAARDDAAVPLAQMNTALADKASGADLADLVSRVDELEKNGGGGAPSYTDNGVAYRKLVPYSALGVAAITDIGGATYRFKNLYDPSALAGQHFTAEDGSTLDVGEDGHSMTVSPNSWEYGTRVSTAPILFRDIFPEAKIGKQYNVSYNTNVGNSGYGYGSGSIEPIYDAFVLTESIYNGPLEFTNGWDYDDIGNQYATWCEFYGIELIDLNRQAGVDYDTKITSVEVVGKNLWSTYTPGTSVKNGVTVTCDENGVYTLNGTCTADGNAVNINMYVPQGKYYFLRDFAEGNFPQDEKVRVAAEYPWNGGMHLSVSNSGNLSMAFGKHDSPTEQVTLRIRLYRGHTYDNCKIYPMLVMGTAEPKEFIPATKQVYGIPTEVLSLPAYGKWYDAELYNRIVFREDKVVYEQRVNTSGQPLSPFVETDITSALAWDGFVSVEDGGLITFKNPHSDPVPSTIVYQTK